MDDAGDDIRSEVEPIEYRINFVERFIRVNKDVIILFLISMRSMSGTGLIREIFSISNVFLQQGSVYPILYSLEEKDLIRAKYERGNMKKKIYYITPSGQDYAQSLIKDLMESIFLLNSMGRSLDMLPKFDFPLEENSIKVKDQN